MPDRILSQHATSDLSPELSYAVVQELKALIEQSANATASSIADLKATNKVSFEKLERETQWQAEKLQAMKEDQAREQGRREEAQRHSEGAMADFIRVREQVNMVAVQDADLKALRKQFAEMQKSLDEMRNEMRDLRDSTSFAKGKLSIVVALISGTFVAVADYVIKHLHG